MDIFDQDMILNQFFHRELVFFSYRVSECVFECYPMFKSFGSGDQTCYTEVKEPKTFSWTFLSSLGPQDIPYQYQGSCKYKYIFKSLHLIMFTDGIHKNIHSPQKKRGYCAMWVPFDCTFSVQI